jgi:hypothetical protein
MPRESEGFAEVGCVARVQPSWIAAGFGRLASRSEWDA